MKILSEQLVCHRLVLTETELGACLFKNTSLPVRLIYAIFWSRLLEKTQHLKIK